MAQTTTTLVIKSKTSEFEKGLNDSKNSFKQWTQSIDSLTGGLASKLTNVLANPWTAVAGGITLATKSLADLTQAGMVGQDKLLKFSAMLGSKSQASSLIGAISELSDTSFDSRDAIEALAEKLVGAGHSAEEVKNILSATIDISNTSGRSFEQVGNAIEQAFNGSSTEIERMVPSLKTLGDEAWQSGEAIKHIGDELHDASVQIASGSLSNQLGAIGNSWEQIKENLGVAIVTQIQSTGVLTTICEWLDKIEEHTRKTSEESDRKATINLGIEGGKAGVENLLRGGIATEAELKDLIGTRRTQLSSAGFEVPSYLEEAWSWVSGGRQSLIDKYNEEFYNIIKGWEEYYQYRPDWEIAQQISRLETFNTQSEYSIYNKEGYEKLLGQMQSRMSSKKASTSSTLRTSTAETLTKCAWGNFDQVTAEDWETVFETLSLSDDLWDMWSDDAYTYYDAWNLSKASAPQVSKATVEAPTYHLMTYAEHMARRQANDAIRNHISAQLESQRVEAPTYHLMTYAEHMARRQANDAIRNHISAQLESQRVVDEAIEEVYRDHSILGLAMQDMGLGYTPVGAETVAPSFEKFEISSLWLNGLKPVDVKFGVGETLNYWNTEASRRTTGGGGINAIEGAYLSSSGKWELYPKELKTFLSDYMNGIYTDEEASKIGEHFGLSTEELAIAIKNIEDENTLKTISTINSAISVLGNLITMWGDGKYTTGEVGSTISGIGSLVSLISPTWGAGIQLAGAGVGLLETLFGRKDSTSIEESGMDASYKASVHQYTGGLELHIHNSFENANIVGEDGMGELARTIQRQIEMYAYEKNL